MIKILPHKASDLLVRQFCITGFCIADFALQVFSQVLAEIFLDGYQVLAEIFRGLVRGLVLIQIFVEGLYPHIASIRHKIRNGGIAVVHSKLHIGLHPGHALCHYIGVLFLAVMVDELGVDLVPQLLVVLPALPQQVFHAGVLNFLHHLINGGDGHL